MLQRSNLFVIVLVVALGGLVFAAYKHTVGDPAVEKVTLLGARNFTDQDLAKVLTSIRQDFGGLHKAGPSLIRKRIMLADWVRESKVTREAFGRITIEIEEYSPVAILLNGAQRKVVDASARVIALDGGYSFGDLPILSGEIGIDNIDEALWLHGEFTRTLADDLLPVKEISRVLKRRWHVILTNGLEIKFSDADLPAQFKRLHSAVKSGLFQQRDISAFRVLDLRSPKRVVLKPASNDRGKDQKDDLNDLLGSNEFIKPFIKLGSHNA